MTAIDLIKETNAELKERLGDTKPPYKADMPCYYCYLRVYAAKTEDVKPDDVCALCIHNWDWGK